ncbi:MAG TPA: metal ABC transporter permease, partial [Rubrivivax sp.]|nr:metal ABC transporter permease [Rubrivivax sp.]
MLAALHAWLLEPFADFGFMRRALVACAALALASAPIGTLLVVRRMSLIGDAMAHALLPGAALGFALAATTCIFSVAAQAHVPALVPRETLAAANARMELARAGATAAGPA